MTDAPETVNVELRQFMGRLMTGYEAAHRRVADLCEVMALRAEKAEAVAARSLELQVRLAEEREAMISRKHQRELEADAARTRQEAFADVTRDVRALVPLVGKKLFGVPFSGNDSHGLQDLLATLTTEQIGTVVESGRLELSQAQRQLLAATLDSLAKPKAEAAE